MAEQQVIRVGTSKDKAVQSKAQKEFNRLTKKIEKTEAEIKDLRTGAEKVQQRVASELSPLLAEMSKLQAQLVRVYDRAHDDAAFKKAEKKKLAHLIQEIAYEVADGEEMADIRAIYDKYSEQPHEEEVKQAQAEEIDQIQAILSQFGIKIDIDPNNPEAALGALQEQIAQLQEADEQQAREAAERRAKRPKTEKQQAKEAKKEEEARNSTKSVRTLYMDLVKAFHPDRETDETEKARKTEIMQRVTQAYEASDLLALLRLQLEFNRIDQDHLETLADEQLKYYNKILKEQATELDGELYQLQMQLGQMSGAMFGMIHSSAQLEFKLSTDINAMKRQIKQTKSDLKLFADRDMLKLWLKNYKIPKQQQFTYFDMM